MHLLPEPTMTKVCALAGCERTAPRTKLCDMHRKRVSREGRPGEPEPRIECTRLSEDELTTIMEGAGKIPAEHIAAIIGRHPKTIQRAANNRGASTRTRRPGRQLLSEAHVREIRRRSAQGESGMSIARDFACGYENVLAVINRKTWKDVL